MSSSPAPESSAIGIRPAVGARDAHRNPQSGEDDTANLNAAPNPICVLIVVPTLDGGAADAGALALVRILRQAGHRAVVASRAGRLLADVTAAGGEFVPLDVDTHNPIAMLRNAAILNRLARERHCDAIHAFGRAGAWSAYFAARLCGIPFVTSWYKGFREQNIFKHLYNGVMARGDRVIAVSDEIAHLINDRYRTPWQRIAVVPGSIDFERFDPRIITSERIKAVRRAWGVSRDTKVILITGRIARRKGHHIVVKAIRRLKDLGLKDFLCVFVGEDRGRSHYTGELWDLVLATGTMDVIRMATPVTDMPAAYAAACVVVSAAVQLEGVQRAILEAQATARPVIVSDLAAGADVVLAAPTVPEGRCAGLRVQAGNDADLAAAIVRLFSLEEPARNAMGLRGRDWVLEQFDAGRVATQTLRLYGEIAGREMAPALVPQSLHGSDKISAI
jgi:glycosyltransferase involved in cell wall biosynthesis